MLPLDKYNSLSKGEICVANFILPGNGEQLGKYEVSEILIQREAALKQLKKLYNKKFSFSCTVGKIWLI